jgi:PAS domain S-box-containing protein
MIWSVDPEEYGLLSYNKSLRDYFMIERGIKIKIGDRPVDLFLSKEYIDRWDMMYKTALSQGAYNREYQVSSGTRTLALNLTVIQEDRRPTAISVFGKDITESKRAYDALAERERTFRLLTEKSNLGIFISQGKMVYVNQCCSKTFGYRPDEIIGKLSPQDLIHPDDVQNLSNRINEILSGIVVTSSFIYKGVRKGGATISIEVYGIATEYLGRPAIMGILTDVTERRLSEEKISLRNSDLLKLNRFAIELANLSGEDAPEALITKQVRNLTSAEAAIFSEFDPVKRTTTTRHIEMDSGLLEKVIHLLGRKIQDIHAYVSDEHYKLMTNEIIGYQETLHEASFGAIPRAVSSTIQALLKVDRIIGIAYLVEGKLYGTSLLLIGKGKPDPQREILENYIHLAASVLRRKRAEDLLKQSEFNYRNIYDNALEGIFQTSLEGEIITCNESFAKMLGYSSSEEARKSANEIMDKIWESEDERNQFASQFEKQDIVQGHEYHFRRTDGSVFWVALNAKLVRDKQGHKLYYEGFLEDIDNRKKTELELIKSKEKAEESERLKSAFLANMSHEIRTPMNGIIGFTELLKEQNLSAEEQQEFILTIQKSGARMLNTINSIVDISKIESGLMQVTIKETNINEQVEFIYKFFLPEIEIKGLQFLFNIGLPSKESIINTDSEKVYAILTNLVKNAIKFTTTGSIEVGYEKKGRFLEFYVKDTGEGISPDQISVIFERFRQGSESLSRNYEGSGLGLSISKSYTEMLGGKMWVESEEGKGSNFLFTIPYFSEFIKGKEDAANVPVKKNGFQIKNLNIMVVEDDDTSFSLLKRSLQKITHKVIRAGNGIDAISLCKDNPDLDLILMDVRMPKMDGYEATRQIRQFNRNVIIIAQTAYGFLGEREKAISSGCNDYISKPIDLTRLFELVRQQYSD